MSVPWEIFKTPFAQWPLEQKLLAALVLLCCAALIISSMAFAARRLRPARHYERRPVGRPVLISWRDGVGPQKSDEGICQDVSFGGTALLLPFPLKV